MTQMKDRPHATPARFDPGGGVRQTQAPGDLRSIVLPAIGAVALVVLFFVLLLSTPSSQPSGGEVADATIEQRVVSPHPASAAPSTIGRSDSACDVPRVDGKAGIVGTRFRGQMTSSGHPYEPGEATCIVNAAGSLGELAYGSEVQLQTLGEQGQTSTCEIIGRWNGAKHTDRILLVSGRVAEELAFGRRGLVEVATDCPTEKTARGDRGRTPGQG